MTCRRQAATCALSNSAANSRQARPTSPQTAIISPGSGLCQGPWRGEDWANGERERERGQDRKIEAPATAQTAVAGEGGQTGGLRCAIVHLRAEQLRSQLPPGTSHPTLESS